jgi:hypothetical protein
MSTSFVRVNAFPSFQCKINQASQTLTDKYINITYAKLWLLIYLHLSFGKDDE